MCINNLISCLYVESSNWHQLRLDSAPGRYKDTVWCPCLFSCSVLTAIAKSTLVSLRMIPVYSGVTPDFFFLEGRLLPDSKFDSHLWLFLLLTLYLRLDNFEAQTNHISQTRKQNLISCKHGKKNLTNQITGWRRKKVKKYKHFAKKLTEMWNKKA